MREKLFRYYILSFALAGATAKSQSGTTYVAPTPEKLRAQTQGDPNVCIDSQQKIFKAGTKGYDECVATNSKAAAQPGYRGNDQKHLDSASKAQWPYQSQPGRTGAEQESDKRPWNPNSSLPPAVGQP